MGTITKRLLGKEDVKLWDGSSVTTFTGPSSTGGTLTLTRLDWPGVDVKAVFGGQTNSEISQAISTANSANRVLWLAPGTWDIAADLTIPTNIAIYVPYGALLQVASGKTLTVNGPILAGPYQIFSGSGTATYSSAPGIQLGLWASGGSDTVEVPALTVNGVAIDSSSFATDETAVKASWVFN